MVGTGYKHHKTIAAKMQVGLSLTGAFCRWGGALKIQDEKIRDLLGM